MTAPLADAGKIAVLAERVEAVTGPDRELDCLIWCAVKDIEPEWQGVCLVAGSEGVIGWADLGKHARNFSTNRQEAGPGSILAYTGSLDAAMTLVPEGWNWMAGARDQPLARAYVNNGELAFVGVGMRLNPKRQWLEVVAATPALALCAATLRARAALEAPK